MHRNAIRPAMGTENGSPKKKTKKKRLDTENSCTASKNQDVVTFYNLLNGNICNLVIISVADWNGRPSCRRERKKKEIARAIYCAQWPSHREPSDEMMAQSMMMDGLMRISIRAERLGRDVHVSAFLSFDGAPSK